MFYKKALQLSFVLLLSTATLTHAMMSEEEVATSTQTYLKTNPLKAQNKAKEKLTFENYPTQTTCIRDAFVLVTELFEHNLNHFQFMDGLLKEVMETKTNRVLKFKEYFGKVKISFDKRRYVKGRTEIPLEDHCSELDSIHQVVILKYKKLINDLKGRIAVINEINELCEKNKVLPKLDFFAQAADLFIERFTEYKKAESGRLDSINEVFNRHRKSKNKISPFKTSLYTDIFKEDYLITTYLDTIMIFSKAIDILAPYSSHPPETRDVIEEEAEKKQVEEQISLNNANDKSKRKRERKRLQSQRFADGQSQNKSVSLVPPTESEKPQSQDIANTHQNSVPIFDKDFNEGEKEDIHEAQPKNHLPIPQEEILSLPKEDKQTPFLPEFKEEQTQPTQKIIEISSKPKEKGTAQLSTKNRPKRNRKPNSRTEKTLIASPSKPLQISKRNFKTLDNVFTHPILNSISIDAFDTLIESEAGFRGRVYGGHRSHIYEVYLLLTEEQKPSHFLNFEEYQKGKKEKHNIKKYSFTLHRPHPRGKSKKGKTRDMYPQLVTLARERLEDFKLTPNTIRQK